MKNSYLIKVLIALFMVLLLSQANASGMKYDPIENYYNTYYGMDSLVDVNDSEVAIKSEATVNIPAVDPYDTYYDIFYEMAEEGKSTQEPKAEVSTANDMSDPLNFYKW